MIYNLGRVVPLFKGTYDAATTYTFLDVVFYDNSSFVALDTTTGNLPTDTDHWLPVALKGLTQDPTPAQMETIISTVETYLTGNIVDDLKSTDTDKPLSANMGREAGLRTKIITLVGDNNTQIYGYIYATANHTFRIYPNKTDVDFSGVSLTSSESLLFGIYSAELLSDPYTRLYRRTCDDKTSPLQEYYDITTDKDGYLVLIIRATEGETVKFYIEDITALNQTIEEQISPITEEVFGYSENISNLYQNGTGVFYNTPYNADGYTDISFRRINGKTSHTAFIGQTRLNNLKNRGFVSVEITANPEYDAYITFAIASTASLANTPLTLQQLLTNHIICSVHSETAAFLVPAGTTQVFDIPEDCTNIFFTGVNYQQEDAPTEPPYRVPSNVRFINNKQTLSEQINNLSEIKEDGWDWFKFDARHYPMQKFYITNSGNVSTSGDYYSVQIPLYEAKYVKIETNTNSICRFNFTKQKIANGVIVPATGYTAAYSSQESNITKTYTVPSDATYLYIYLGSLSKYFSSTAGYCPKSVSFYMKKNNSDSKTTGFEIGNVGIDGNIHNDNTFAISGYVDLSRGFYMKFTDEYKVYSAHLYDLNGKLISYNYLPPTDNYFSYAYWEQDYSFYSIAYCIPYQMKIVVKRRDGQPITNTDNIVKQFVYLNDNRLHLENPDFDMQYYNNFRARLRQLSACIFNPVAYMPTTTTNDSVDGHSLTNMNMQYFREGQYRAGVDYSSNYEYSKAVGMEVSLKTYLSAIADKYSVCYTENLSKSGADQSSYGISYTQRGVKDATGYYGIVCSSLVGYALNLRMLYRADYWKDAHPSKPEESVVLVENINGYNVKPGDLIWNTGHISVISEIYDDELGNRKFIVWSEQTKPSPYICAITPEEFNHRLERHGYGTPNATMQVMRYQNWNNVSTPCNFDVDIDMNDFFNANYIHEPIKNIQTFAGDYATFTKGDKLFFTVNISHGFTKFQVLDSNGDVVEGSERNLSNLTASTIYPQNTEWANLDYTSNNLSGGLYTARLIDNDGNVSESTHFEIVEITFPTPTKTGSTYNCTFSCSSNATPYLLRKEEASGYNTTGANNGTDYEFLDGTETSAALNWTITSTYRYIKLFCRGKYGTAIKKVDAYGL